jgi:hypothetical protein
VLSGEDYTAKEFVEHAQTNAAWKHYQAHPKLTQVEIAGVDHTFSSASSRRQAEEASLNWLLASSNR